MIKTDQPGADQPDGQDGRCGAALKEYRGGEPCHDPVKGCPDGQFEVFTDTDIG